MADPNLGPVVARTPRILVPDILYRAVRSKRWLAGPDKKLVNSAAYIRRPDEIGLSVTTSVRAAFELVPGNHGVARIALVSIRRVINPLSRDHLDVKLTRRDHGEIFDVPKREDHPLEAEAIAGELARASTVI